MALIAIPFARGTSAGVVVSGDAAGMLTQLTRVIAGISSDFLADLSLTGAGAGAIWQACMVFTDEAVSETPLVPVGDVLLAVVVAGEPAALNLQLDLAGQALGVAGAKWIAKVITAGAGAGAAWMGVIVASKSARPLPCDCPPPSPPRLLAHADNGSTTIPIAIAPTATALVVTGPVVVLAGQRVLVWARIFAHFTHAGTLFSAVVATPTVGPPIFLDGTADTVDSDATITFAGAFPGATSTPALPAGTYTFTLQASVTGGAVGVVDGFPPAVTPGAQLTIEVVGP